MRSDFVAWDDNINIYGNPHIRGLTLENLRWIATDTSYVRRYIPLAWLGWAVQFQICGLNPGSWHFGDILLHAFNAVLVFLIIERLTLLAFSKPELNEKRLWCGSAIGALIWALHPLRVEVVAWASGRLYEQATGFLLISVLCYVYAFQSTRHKRLLLLGAAVSFMASLLTYPIGLFCVFIFPLLDFYPLRRLSMRSESQGKHFRALLIEKIPFFAIAGLMLLLTLRARAQASGIWAPPASVEDFGLLARCMQGFYVWSCYVWKSLLPIQLSPMYTDLLTFRPFALPFVGSFLFVVGISTWLFWHRRRWPGALIAWLAYLVIMVPMLGLMEHPHVANDRYSYLPAIAISVCISGLLQMYGRMRMVFIGGAVWIVFLGASAITQAKVWRNSETLFKHLIVRLNNHPYREHIHLRLGIYYETQGRSREALEQYKLCLTIEPTEVKVLTKLAVLLTMCEEQDVRNGPEAVAYAQKACELTYHSDPQKLTVLASALAESGRSSEAIAILLKAQELARAQGNEGFVAISSKLMEFYRAGKTARDYMASTR
ncbi:MAG TPA: hypothetical protein VMZ27_17375 [Candidatus Saccharimonadales bacterium]|nr:hypothetical protein [Candidatus Saccharimonadales bacterium]